MLPTCVASKTGNKLKHPRGDEYETSPGKNAHKEKQEKLANKALVVHSHISQHSNALRIPTCTKQ